MLAELDLMIRGAVIGISALTFAILVSNLRTRRKSISMGAVALALAGIMTKDQGVSPAWSPDAQNPALFLSHFMPLALTWFVMDIFLDQGARDAASKGLISLAAVVVGLCFVPMVPPFVQMTLTLLLFAGLLYVVLQSAQGDLVDNRRSFRVVFVGALAVFGIFKTLVYGVYDVASHPDWMPTAFALAMLMFEIIFAYWALRPGGSLWNSEETPISHRADTSADRVDTHLLAKIDSAMQDELWRREGLTIGGMADELNIPEHRLRHAINRDLGYRNFPAFVNGYRIDAAKAALSAPENAQTTILEIAYDVGFASLGPFNKAFRATTGTSPREFRRGASVPA